MKALAIICNVFIPGLGTLVIGKFVQAFFQWAIWALGVFFNFSIMGLILGLPLMAVGWIWALLTALQYQEPTAPKQGVHTSGKTIGS